MTPPDYSHRHLRLGWWWLFVFAGAYNAITLKRPAERSTTQAAIIRVFSVLDDGDGTLRLFGDAPYTTALFGIPIMLATCGCIVRRSGRSRRATAAKSCDPTQE